MTLSNDIKHNDIKINDIKFNDMKHKDIMHEDILQNDVQHNNKSIATLSRTAFELCHAKCPLYWMLWCCILGIGLQDQRPGACKIKLFTALIV